MVYLYNGILFSHKENEIIPIGDNIDGHQGYYARWNKSDRERQTLYYLICIEIKKKLIETEQIGGCQKQGVGKWVKEGVKRYKFLVIRWVSYGDVMYSMVTALYIWKLLRE